MAKKETNVDQILRLISALSPAERSAAKDEAQKTLWKQLNQNPVTQKKAKPAKRSAVKR